MSEEQRREITIFLEAIEIDDPQRLTEYLDDACSEHSQLRADVDALLAAHRRDNSFLERPAPGLDQTIDVNRDALEAGLSPTFASNAAVVIGDANHSVLKSLGTKLTKVPRVALRDSESDGAIEKPNSPQVPPETGEDSRYQLHGEIARGGMGAIIKGRDKDLGRDLAIKVLLDSQKDKPEVIERFVEEAQIGGQLQHPGIVPVYELGQFSDERPFFSMKLVKGETLASLLSSRSNPGDDQAKLLGIFEQVCQTMAYAHSRGVIHRDLKPANIMVGAFGEVQVMDWGLAKVISKGGVADEAKARDQQRDVSVIRTHRSEGSDAPGEIGSQTHMGSVMGTPAYMPPEQALGEVDRVDERADVFGLGAVLCEILTGHPPYIGDDGTEVFRKASRGKLDDCFDRLDSRDVDQQLVALAKKALAVEPDDRWQNAGELANGISDYLSGVQERLKQAELDRAKAQTRRKLSLAIAGLMLLLAVGSAGAAVYIQEQRQLQAKLASDNAQLAQDEKNQRRLAEDQRQQALRQLQISRLTTLAGQSESVRRRSPVRSLLLAIEAADSASGLDGAAATIAHETLLSATTSIGGLLLPGGRAAISPDSQWLVTWGSGNTTQLWELTNEDPTERSIELKGHTDEVLSVSFSSDSHWLITGSRDSTALLWDLSNSHVGAPIASFRHEGPVSSVAFDNEVRWLATASQDTSVRLWDLEDLSRDAVVFGGHDRPLNQVKISPDGRWLSSRSQGQLRLWDLSSADPTRPLTPIRTAGWAVFFSGDGRWLATMVGPNTIKLIDLRSDDPASSQTTLQSHKERIHDMRISPNGRWLASVSWDGTGQLWDLHSDTPLQSMTKLKGHSHRVWGATFSKDSRRLITGDSFGTVRVWDLTVDRPGTKSIVLRGHEGAAGMVGFTPDNRWAISCGWDQSVRLWDLNSTDPTEWPIILRGKFGNFRVSSDSRWLVCFGKENCRLWNISDEGRAPSPVVLNTQSSYRKANAAVSSDGRWLVSSIGSDLRVTDMRSEDPALNSRMLHGHDGKVLALAISPDGRWVVSGGDDGMARVWDLWDRDGDNSSILLSGHDDSISSVAISGGGRWVVTGSADRTSRLWDLRNKRSSDEVRVMRDHDDTVVEVAISADESWMVTRSLDFKVRIWNFEEKNVETQPILIEGHQAGISAVAISPDSRWLATGSRSGDSTVRLWDLNAADLLETPVVLTYDPYVEVLAFSPDGRWLAASGWGKYPRMWDLRAEDPEANPLTFGLHDDGGVYSLAFSPDSRWLVTGSQDATARLWDVAAADPTASSLVLRGHKGTVSKVAVSTAENWVITAGATSVRLWDLDRDRRFCEHAVT